MSAERKVLTNTNKTRHHSTDCCQIYSGQHSGDTFAVEKVSATSTTSPKADTAHDEDMKSQTVEDKKRKKRIKESNSRDYKHSRIDGKQSL